MGGGYEAGETMTISGCPITKLPKRNFLPASNCNANFDATVEALGVKPRRLFLKCGRGWYWIAGIALTSGRFATLCKWEVFPHTIVISLELVRNVYFYEKDLLEILAFLNVKVRDASRQGAFKWKKTRSNAL
jgi:uncharacterized membrane protein YphA (DoxX/SURF4 family)